MVTLQHITQPRAGPGSWWTRTGRSPLSPSRVPTQKTIRDQGYYRSWPEEAEARILCSGQKALLTATLEMENVAE